MHITNDHHTLLRFIQLLGIFFSSSVFYWPNHMALVNVGLKLNKNWVPVAFSKSNKRRITAIQLMSKCHFKHTKQNRDKTHTSNSQAHSMHDRTQMLLNRYIVCFYCFELCERKMTMFRIIVVLHHTTKRKFNIAFHEFKHLFVQTLNYYEFQ